MLTPELTPGRGPSRSSSSTHADRLVRAQGVLDQGIAQEQLANGLLQRLLREDESVAERYRARRGHRLCAQQHQPGRHHHHRDHLPCRAACTTWCRRRAPSSRSAGRTASCCG